jgi:dolichyl-phosphate-mannose--protein O-mannosyl transferase
MALHDYIPAIFVSIVVYGLILSDVLRTAPGQTALTKRNVAMIVATAILITAPIWLYSEISSFKTLSRQTRHRGSVFRRTNYCLAAQYY